MSAQKPLGPTVCESPYSKSMQLLASTEPPGNDAVGNSTPRTQSSLASVRPRSRQWSVTEKRPATVLVILEPSVQCAAS